MKKQLPVRIEEEIQEALKQLAKEDKRSFSNYINMVLENHIEEEMKKKKYKK